MKEPDFQSQLTLRYERMRRKFPELTKEDFALTLGTWYICELARWLNFDAIDFSLIVVSEVKNVLEKGLKPDED